MKAIRILVLLMTAACVEGVSKDPQSHHNSGSNAAKNPVSWSARSGEVTLSADDFYIMANGTKYLGEGTNIDVHSDPGTSQYTTLELTWMENAVEMRLYIYFNSDGTSWWSNEMRTYNGMAGSAEDWIYYYDTYFKTAVGSSFTGDLDVTSSMPLPGSIHFENLQLKVTFSP
jgi:hypothetical protein